MFHLQTKWVQYVCNGIRIISRFPLPYFATHTDESIDKQLNNAQQFQTENYNKQTNPSDVVLTVQKLIE